MESQGTRVTEAVARERVVTPSAVRDQRHELERVRLLGMLVANVAHEINNHLSYLLGNLERADRHLPRLREAGESAAVEQLESDVEAAMDGARRIADIVRSLSSFARPETRAQQIDPLRAVDAAVRLARGKMAGRAHLILDLAPLPMIDACESQLSQVLLNLLLNAADALPDNAPEQHQVFLRSSVQRDRVVIEVEDTGHGIAADDLERIFEPFYTTKPAGAGTGLGLSVSRDFVERMGGTISVRSRLGQGSTFRVELPIPAGRREA